MLFRGNGRASAESPRADVVSREMVAFEWLEEADTDIFRDILKGFIS